ncbi:MAG: hypothetical protein JW953_00940 [Anaerolineae bacterium]|nr:hypothetical protein [Anaerolineae bacterium]
MLEFLRPIVAFDTWIYIGLGLIALFFLRLMWLARKDRARSIFTLERENTRARMNRAFIGLTIVLGLMLGVYYVSLVTPPLLPPPPNTPTPTPMLDLPPTPTPPPLLPTPTPTATPLPPPTVFIGETPTPTPPAVQGAPPACPHPGVTITQPGDGAPVSGVVQVTGAASIDNFDYYKFEFRVSGGNDWNFIQRFNNPVLDGVLGSWNSDTVSPGEYEFRLVVVDTIGNYPEPCVVRLLVE